jgi:hypothetical protein
VEIVNEIMTYRLSVSLDSIPSTRMLSICDARDATLFIPSFEKLSCELENGNDKHDKLLSISSYPKGYPQDVDMEKINIKG